MYIYIAWLGRDGPCWWWVIDGPRAGRRLSGGGRIVHLACRFPNGDDGVGVARAAAAHRSIRSHTPTCNSSRHNARLNGAQPPAKITNVFAKKVYYDDDKTVASSMQDWIHLPADNATQRRTRARAVGAASPAAASSRPDNRGLHKRPMIQSNVSIECTPAGPYPASLCRELKRAHLSLRADSNAGSAASEVTSAAASDVSPSMASAMMVATGSEMRIHNSSYSVSGWPK